jgi:uncharacterized protein YggE
MLTRRLIFILAIFLVPLAAHCQIQSDTSGRKTIEISATEKVRVPAEVATIKIGIQNQAATKDTAYAENTRAANKILQALLDTGVPKEAIETETLNLQQEQDRYGSKPEQSQKYSASQQWLIQSKASEAQKIVDIAVAAGANQIEDVEWSVVDDKQLEAKAYAAALKRAKDIAEQTATRAGLKVGEIISIVNAANPLSRFDRFARAGGMGMYDLAAPPKMAMLKLQPGMVEREASVTVTHSIAP